MNYAKIENWSVVGIGADPYKAPEQRSIRLMGEVYNHPNHEDGKKVITSSIMHTDGKEVITSNTKYMLGKICGDYKDWYYKEYGKEINEVNPFPD